MDASKLFQFIPLETIGGQKGGDSLVIYKVLNNIVGNCPRWNLKLLQKGKEVCCVLWVVQLIHSSAAKTIQHARNRRHCDGRGFRVNSAHDEYPLYLLHNLF